jgi:hypothetical protein
MRGEAAMLRRSAQGRAPLDPGVVLPDGAGDAPRPRPARQRVAIARLVLAPFAAIAAALAGAIFLVLLPICGIATIAEGFARICWDGARDGVSARGRGARSHR